VEFDLPVDYGTYRFCIILQLTLCLQTAWDAVPEGVVIKAFKRAGVSNALDGSEDDLVFELKNEVGGLGDDAALDPSNIRVARHEGKLRVVLGV